MKYVLLVVCLAVGVLAQKPARIGPDGKPLLNRPIVEECKKRISHMKWEGHHYFLSWREPWHKFEDWDWFNGRNFCRDRCMDLVSFDTPGEYEIFAKIMQKDNVSSIFTSGRKCNFKGKGCDAAHLQPININGWFWAGAANTRIPATNTPHPQAFWSFSGESGQPQPDNLEGKREGPIDTEFDVGVTIEGLQEYHDEACLAVLNNKYSDGIAWHDVACHFRSVIVCEDSDQLMNLVQTQNGEDVRETVTENDKKVELESILANEVQPVHHAQHAPHHAAHHPQPHDPLRQAVPNFQPPHPQAPQVGVPRPNSAAPPRPAVNRPRPRRPGQNGGFLGALGFGGRFPFLF